MIKNKRQRETTNDSTQKLNTNYKNIGERIFTTLMSLALIGMVAFYASLPLRSAAYRQGSQTDFLVLDSVITDDDNEVDANDKSEADKDADTDGTSEADDKSDTDKDSDSDDKSDTDKDSDSDDKSDTDKDSNSTTQTKKQYAKITYDGLNVREGSTVSTETVGKAYVDEEYELVEILDEIQWAKIIYKGEEAFVHTKFIEVITK